MKRTGKFTLAALLLAGISILSLSCAPGEDTGSTTETELFEVQRGDLTVDITAVGNLALSLTENLAFEIPGTVSEVLVEEGDTVEEGQVLASLDTSEQEKRLETLESQLAAAEKQVTTKQRDIPQAEINLANAEIALEETNTTYSADDYKVALADLDEAARNLADTVRKMDRYPTGTPGYIAYQDIVRQAQARLTTAENKYESMISGFDTKEVDIKRLQLEIAIGKLEDAQVAVEDAGTAVRDAEAELREVKNENLIITAPFSGFISSVNVKGGDVVKKGTIALELADPTRFEADIFINEMDIFQIRTGGPASIQVDAAQGITLAARVTHISPTATIQQGVVTYKVRVEIQSMDPEMMTQLQERRRSILPDLATGELPDRLQQAVDAGRITEEQAEQMMERIASGDIPSPPEGGEFGGAPGGFSGRGDFGDFPGGTPGESQGGQRGFTPSMMTSDFQLREGLSVTVSIVVDERAGVLLVPNTAITSQAGQNYIQVISSEGTAEPRVIETGISDWQYTEVISGVSEGEEVVITRNSAPTSTTTGPSGGGFIFGRGRP
ncbi:MAG: biotin/lipoyl-binding protein [Dehalococcoidales bacterium]